MGEPILLKKGNETMNVYGRNQAAVHVAEGWALVDDSISLPVPPDAVAPKPTTKRKPRAKAEK